MFLLGPNTFAEGKTRLAQQDASITSRDSAAHQRDGEVLGLAVHIYRHPKHAEAA